MFWRFGGYANISTIDTLLEKPDATLEDVLDESDLIQELKQHNTKLIEYLRDENTLRKLLNYVIAPAPTTSVEDEEQDADGATSEEKSKAKKGFLRTSSDDATDEEQDKAEQTAVKYAYVACEVLSSETWSILESLMENKDHLREFWSYMRQPPPLDGLQAGYFTKVNETLFEKKTEDMLEFFKSLDDIIPAMLQHVDCPMVMDLLLKIISLEKHDGGQGIVDWLVKQDLIPRLLSNLAPEYLASTQTSAGDFLKAIITISANASQTDGSCIGPNSLTRQLVSEPCMESLISSMLKGGNPLTVGVGIVIEVIRKNNSDYDPENGHNPDVPPTSHDPIYLGTLLRMFAQHVPDFVELILSSKHTVTEGEQTRVEDRGLLLSAWGTNIEPLGFDRFKTCELMAELLHCSNMGLLNERGSETFIRQRDTERERLQAAGAFESHKDEDSGVEIAVEDSSALAAALKSPQPGSESPEELRITNSNGEDDGFEKVAVDVPSEPEIVLDEKVALEDDTGSAEPFTEINDRPKLDLGDEFVDEPLQSPKLDTPESDGTAKAEDAESPRTIKLEQEVQKMGLDETVMRTPPNEEDDDLPNFHDEYSSPVVQHNEFFKTNTLNLSPHPEDKPAPLFASKSDPNKTPTSLSPGIRGGDNTSEINASEQSETELQTVSIIEEPPYEPQAQIDIDGKPVVGDYLKIQFVENKVVPTVLSFFFRFPWNNFLHNVVYDVVQQVFNGPMDHGYNRSLAIDLFETGCITEQIVEGQNRSNEAQEKQSMRLGYMGHLTLVAEEVVKFSERHPPDMLSQNVMSKVLSRQWIDYVEQTLSETRERDNAILGGVRPDISGGPRQAVLNAVNAAQGFGGGAAGTAIDSIDLSNNGSASSGVFSGSSGLLSGFGSSSDDDDEEMEEADDLMDEETRRAAQEQLKTADAGPGAAAGNENSFSPDSSAAAVPLPLLPPPPSTSTTNSAPRARRQFAARLALQHKKQQQQQKEQNDNDESSSSSPMKTSHASSPTSSQRTDRLSASPRSAAVAAADDPFAALDDRRATAKSVRNLFSSSSSKSGGADGGGGSGFDDDDEDDEDDDGEDERSSGGDGSDESDEVHVLEATTSRERRPLEVDDEDDVEVEEEEEDEWGDFEVGANTNTATALGQIEAGVYKLGVGETGNSSDEDAEDTGERARTKLKGQDAAKMGNGAPSSEDDNYDDDDDGEALVEIAMPKKEVS